MRTYLPYSVHTYVDLTLGNFSLRCIILIVCVFLKLEELLILPFVDVASQIPNLSDGSFDQIANAKVWSGFVARSDAAARICHSKNSNKFSNSRKKARILYSVPTVDIW